MALDKIIGQIQSLTKNNQNLSQLKDLLRLEEKEISKHKQEIPQAIQKLDFQRHSYGVLVLL